MKIILASDHAGFSLKLHVKKHLEEKGYSVKDMGVFSEDRANWAEYGAKAASVVSDDPENSMGIIICGSGIGMSIVSNKFKNVRAALCNDEYSAEMSRRHNNANVLNMGERVVSEELAEKIVEIWLNTSFEGGRHADRLEYISNVVEKNNFK
ncbi:MAG: ribose 5-phosphate isomerase B [Candidatus Aminicenantes bacterium]|nr:ribose 5-phosphate isomerase B [Candidatus Aminicenantes bacterium]